jgi:mannose-6-phosphate isomerase-like protein (cupin superfamily)
MQRKKLRCGKGFRVALGTRRSQAAEMVLPPGGKEGGTHNRHRSADQWLYVLSGSGIARVNRRRYTLMSGTLLLIEHGDEHEIENTGEDNLQTLNVYVPPAYDAKGEPLPRGRK